MREKAGITRKAEIVRLLTTTTITQPYKKVFGMYSQRTDTRTLGRWFRQLRKQKFQDHKRLCEQKAGSSVFTTIDDDYDDIRLWNFYNDLRRMVQIYQKQIFSTPNDNQLNTLLQQDGLCLTRLKNLLLHHTLLKHHSAHPTYLYTPCARRTTCFGWRFKDTKHSKNRLWDGLPLTPHRDPENTSKLSRDYNIY